MNRDHTQVGKAKLSAQTFAEIVESFVEPVSYRTMVCFFSLPLLAVWNGGANVCVCVGE